MTDNNRNDFPSTETATDTHDTGNGMSSHSQWTGDEAISRGVSPASQPAADAGTALGGSPTRNSDQTEQGVPESTAESNGYGDTGTTFGTDPSTDKRP